MFVTVHVVKFGAVPAVLMQVISVAAALLPINSLLLATNNLE